MPTSTTETEIEVKFIPKTQTNPDTDKNYEIHPAFTNAGNGEFGELDGIWVAKFAASSNTPTTNGGSNTTDLKVQVKPGVQSWRNITTNEIFSVCRKMTEVGEVLAGSAVDSHMMKNIEWGAVAILSQSKYRIFNSKSSTGTNGDATYQIWNNSSSSYITGTVYGVYDMAGGSWKYVAGCLTGQENAKFGVTIGDDKYVDLYTNTSNSYSNYDGAKIGDATNETKGWNSDYSYFVYSSGPVFVRGGHYDRGINAGIFAFNDSPGYSFSSNSFYVVLVP